MNTRKIFDAYIYVCSECGCLYGCNVPTDKSHRLKKECRSCNEKYQCVHRLVYRFSSKDDNIKPEWACRDQDGVIYKSDGYCSEECVLLRNSMTYSDEEIRNLLRRNHCPDEDIEEILVLLKILRRVSKNILIRDETNKYLFNVFKKILRVDERARECGTDL
jgi:hypothetical protein